MVSCKHCGQTWPRDPRLEVACPDCLADIGVRCRRPSGHGCPEPHMGREELAIERGFMTRRCPAVSGREGAAVAPVKKKRRPVVPASLFDAATRGS